MTRKVLAVAAVFLFVCLTTSSDMGNVGRHTSLVKQCGNGTTLYVGGTGPENYSKIQNAITDAAEGDTIYVFAGIYHENVVVDKPLQLIGEDRNTTVIDGGDTRDVVKLTVDGVTLTGFTIQNGGGFFYNAGGIKLDASSYSVISDNIIIDNGLYGIWVLENTSSHTTISHNLISGNGIDDSGGFNIWLYKSSHNSITDNVIQNGKGYGLGICFWSTHTTVARNVISGNRLEGIKSRYGFDNTIRENTIENNDYFGIRFLNASANNTIERNNIVGNIPLNAFFTITEFAIANRWDGNFWGRRMTFPKPIMGCVRLTPFTRDMWGIPWCAIDWHPVPEICEW
jgi:parallel beta-helix repeat protein